MLQVLPSGSFDPFAIQCAVALDVPTVPYDIDEEYRHDPNMLVLTCGGDADRYIPVYCRLDILEVAQYLERQGQEVTTQNIIKCVKRCYGEWMR